MNLNELQMNLSEEQINHQQQVKNESVFYLSVMKNAYSIWGLDTFCEVEDIGEGFKVGFHPINPYYKYIIKPNGTMIDRVFHYVDKFSEGTCQVSYLHPIKKAPYVETCYNHINTNGNLCFGHNQFIYIGRFVDGIANACIEPGKWNYIDKNGTVLFPQYSFSHTYSFEDGWGEVTKDYKVRNYINKEGVFKF